MTDTDLDDSLMSVASGFVRTPKKNAAPAAPSGAAQTALQPVPASPAPATPDKQNPGPTEDKIQETSAPAVDPTGSDDEEAEQQSLMDLIPQEAQSSRVLGACHREVKKWVAPKTLTKRELTRYRNVAVMVRASEAITGISKLQLGVLLIEAKQRLKHGEWCQYVEAACGIHRRRASSYMAVARIFGKHTTVFQLGWEFCAEIAEKSPPDDIVARIAATKDRITAETIFHEWEQERRIDDAFAGLPLEKPAAVLGRELALDLSAPNVIREVREAVAQKPDPDAARDLLQNYRAKLMEGMDGQAAFASATGHAALEEAPQRRLRLRNLFARVDALARYKDAEVDDRAAALAKEIEDKLLELEQLVHKPE